MSINLPKLFEYYVRRDERISEAGQTDWRGRITKISLPGCFVSEIQGETKNQEIDLRYLGLADCVDDEPLQQAERFSRALPLLYHLAGSYLNLPRYQTDRPYWESGSLRWQDFLGFRSDGPRRGLPEADVILGGHIQQAERIISRQADFDRAALHLASWSLYDAHRRRIDLLPMHLIRAHDADKAHDCPFKHGPG